MAESKENNRSNTATEASANWCSQRKSVGPCLHRTRGTEHTFGPTPSLGAEGLEKYAKKSRAVNTRKLPALDDPGTAQTAATGALVPSVFAYLK